MSYNIVTTNKEIEKKEIIETVNLDTDDEFNEEDELQIDEELDEYLTYYYNSLRVYDIMKTLKEQVDNISNIPLYDKLTHIEVFELLYPNGFHFLNLFYNFQYYFLVYVHVEYPKIFSTLFSSFLFPLALHLLVQGEL